MSPIVSAKNTFDTECFVRRLDLERNPSSTVCKGRRGSWMMEWLYASNSQHKDIAEADRLFWELAY